MIAGTRYSASTERSLRPLPPVSSKAKDYTDRPEEVVDELDDLRTRGIAKVLNKHFTNTTRKLAIEKAEADAALADLQRRRAQTKTFVPSKGGELNPYDKLYVQLQQKRSECRRKEKETMMLYQRYVMKYGKSAKAEPLGSSASKDSQEGGNLSPRHSSTDLKGDPPGKSALGTLDENSEATFSKFYEKQVEREEQERQQQRKLENEKNTQNFMSALNKFMVVSEDEEDTNPPNAVPQLVSSKDSPSPIPSNGKVDPFMSAVSKFTNQTKPDDAVEDVQAPVVIEQEDDEIRSNPDTDARNEIKRDLDKGLGAVVTPEIKRTPSKDPPADDVSESVAEDESMVSQQQDDPKKEDPNPRKLLETDETLISKEEVATVPATDPTPIKLSESEQTLISKEEVATDPTPQNSFENRHTSMAKEEVAAVPATDPTPRKSLENGHTLMSKEEVATVPASPDMVPEAAAITLSPSSHHSTPKSNKVVKVDVNPEAHYFHTTTIQGYDFDDRSIISELTSANSAVTRQLIDEVETEMEDFIKFEMEAIRKMLDSEEDASTVENSVRSENSSLMLTDNSVHVAMRAEAMALEMQKILDDFAKEDASVAASVAGTVEGTVEGTKSIHNDSVRSSSELIEKSTEPTSVYPYKFEPAIPGEEWYVHFDDNYKKEYYVEKNSNRTQWEYPQKVPSPRMEQPVSSDDFLSDMHSVASSRRSLSRRSSRRTLYRKQRKKRRARRLMMSFLALLCVLVTVFYWRINHPGESITAAFFAAMSVKGIVDLFEYSFTDRKEREDLIRQQQETLAKIEKERNARELADKRAKEEAYQRMMKAKKAAEEEAARKLAEKQQCEDESELLEQTEGEGRRHWGCNIPFAYVVPHCWHLSKTEPMFGESDLTFLQ